MLLINNKVQGSGISDRHCYKKSLLQNASTEYHFPETLGCLVSEVFNECRFSAGFWKKMEYCIGSLLYGHSTLLPEFGDY